MSIDVWAQVAIFTHVWVSWDETKVFRGLTGYQRDTPGSRHHKIGQTGP